MDQKDFFLSRGRSVRRKFRRTACFAARKTPHTDADRRDALGTIETSTHNLARTKAARLSRRNRRDAYRECETLTHGLARTTPPDFQGEIDATPAVRPKFRRTASQGQRRPTSKEKSTRRLP
ncbi:hypothetical protein NDU88_002909 [Pleurodeles waltl]|uniref:Uncharacterized protein n=1 Tax=Pleurodeles waltl TaxID=8319 RepID=A0AAV7VDU9_PLEWA|nr:hypothetical protein NDU88_002909 [Pleurodeles waltl]